jgi:hypothetical protein
MTGDALEALRLAYQALTHMDLECRYHHGDFGYLGWTGHPYTSEPRCDSCKRPWRAVRALEAVEHALGVERMTRM